LGGGSNSKENKITST